MRSAYLTSGASCIVVAISFGMATAVAYEASAQEARQHVRVVATGGTIAGGKSGRLDAKELAALVPDLERTARVTYEDFANLPSSRMTPDRQLALAARVQAILTEADAPEGVVVTHGTDSLEETAFLLDLVVASNRPVVFAAAQRPPREPDSDGPRNLLDAVRVAGSEQARGQGVLVVLNGEIHAARDARKTHTVALDAFRSDPGGPLGYVDGERVVFTRHAARRTTIAPGPKSARVELVTLAAGSGAAAIDWAAADGAHGIVIEAFGRGNAPPDAMQAVARARERGVAIVVTSRTRGGRVELDEQVRAFGIVSGQDLDGLKARVLLLLALSHTTDPASIQAMFDKVAGLTP